MSTLNWFFFCIFFGLLEHYKKYSSNSDKILTNFFFNEKNNSYNVQVTFGKELYIKHFNLFVYFVYIPLALSVSLYDNKKIYCASIFFELLKLLLRPISNYWNIS